MSLRRFVPLACVTALMAACATVPKPLQGTYTEISAANAQQDDAAGSRIRWGGKIIETEPGPRETCFFILSRPLDAQARPRQEEDGNAAQNRFVACRSGFYDPDVFVHGRELTIVGTVHGTVTRKIGDYDYAYPRVDADVVYLWPRRPLYVSPPPGLYNPFWGPGWGGAYWGPWDGWGGYGYWGRPVIVPIPRPLPLPPPPRPIHRR